MGLFRLLSTTVLVHSIRIVLHLNCLGNGLLLVSPQTGNRYGFTRVNQLERDSRDTASQSALLQKEQKLINHAIRGQLLLRQCYLALLQCLLP